jgi:hypothetical protein
LMKSTHTTRMSSVIVYLFSGFTNFYWCSHYLSFCSISVTFGYPRLLMVIALGLFSSFSSALFFAIEKGHRFSVILVCLKFLNNT